MPTIYISISGSDSTGDGTISAPFLSIDKAYDTANISDTIHLLAGTFNVYTTLNITKPITITGTDAIINGTDTVFNIQTNDVHINNLTIESSHLTNPVISIDRNSTGSTVPTYYTGNSITYCTIRYTVKGLYLNGTYTIDHNNFERCTGTYSAHVMSIYSSRGVCSISNNTLLDSEHIQYAIYLTSSGSGSFLDACNSKIGTLTIQDNTITIDSFTEKYGSDTMKVLYQDYFNSYNNATEEDYNENTKLALIIENNSIISNLSIKFIELQINSSLSCNMFDHVIIKNNSSNNTFNGVIHFNKTVDGNSITVDSKDINRSIFSIYDNLFSSIADYLLVHADIQNVYVNPLSIPPEYRYINESWYIINIYIPENMRTIIRDPSSNFEGINRYTSPELNTDGADALNRTIGIRMNWIKCEGSSILKDVKLYRSTYYTSNAYAYVPHFLMKGIHSGAPTYNAISGTQIGVMLHNYLETPIFTYILVMRLSTEGMSHVYPDTRFGPAKIFTITTQNNTKYDLYCIDAPGGAYFVYNNGSDLEILTNTLPINTVTNKGVIIAMIYGQTNTYLKIYDTKSDNMNLLVDSSSVRSDSYSIMGETIQIMRRFNYHLTYDIRIYNKEMSLGDLTATVMNLKTQFNLI